MKKVVLFMALVATVAFTSCSKDNDDSISAIVGTWATEVSFTINDQTSVTRDEWIFKNDKTGTYTEIESSEQTMQSAFTWVEDGEFYKVTYIEADKSGDKFKIGNLLGTKTLEDDEGFTIAVKE